MDDVVYLSLGVFGDARGKLVFAEQEKHLPFVIERFYIMKDVPEGAVRGAVMHRALRQVLVALHGGFDVTVDDGWERKVFRVDNEGQALYVPPLLWREVGNFTPGGMALVLADLPIDPAEEEKDYGAFLANARKSDQ